MCIGIKICFHWHEKLYILVKRYRPIFGTKTLKIITYLKPILQYVRCKIYYNCKELDFAVLQASFLPVYVAGSSGTGVTRFPRR